MDPYAAMDVDHCVERRVLPCYCLRPTGLRNKERKHCVLGSQNSPQRLYSVQHSMEREKRHIIQNILREQT